MAQETRRIFILGGGAALGAHQVGALRFLEGQGIRPDAIVGSSIGVLNACLYASGGVDRMEEAWTSMGSIASAFRPSLRHNPLTGMSLVSAEPLAKRIEQFIDFDLLLKSPIDLSFIVLNVSRGEGQFVTNRQARSPSELRTLSRAGWAIPVLFPPVRYRGEYFVDGGFAWNVPLLQAVEMGATEIYVLAVVPTVLPFKRSFRGFPDFMMRVADVMWRTIGNAGYLTTRIDPDGTYHGVPVTVIHPTEQQAGFDLFGLLTSSPERSRRLITAGHRDAKRELARIKRAERARASRPRKTRSRRAEEVVGDVEPAFRHELR